MGNFFISRIKIVGTVNLTNINLFHETCMVNIMVGDKEHWEKSAASEVNKVSFRVCLKKIKNEKSIS